MTREEKAQEFARNCAEYNNLPIEVEHLLHTAFIIGYNEREDEEKNPWHKAIGTCNSDKNLQENASPWHKVSEELPEDEGDYLIAYRVNDYRGLKKVYMQTASFHKEKWHPNAKYDKMQILAWMEIPEIQGD